MLQSINLPLSIQGLPSNCLVFISVSSPSLNLPIEFNDPLKTVLESTSTNTVDLSHIGFCWFFHFYPMSSETHPYFRPPPHFFLIQKLEGPVKIRTVREAPTDCVCPPGKWMFNPCWLLTSRDLAFSLLSAQNCQSHGQENHLMFQAIYGTLWIILSSYIFGSSVSYIFRQN